MSFNLWYLIQYSAFVIRNFNKTNFIYICITNIFINTISLIKTQLNYITLVQKYINKYQNVINNIMTLVELLSFITVLNKSKNL